MRFTSQFPAIFRGKFTKQFLWILLLPLWISPVSAANYFVLPLSTGSHTGADWNNAWALTNITWSSVAAGDTIWIAGGTYTTTSGTLLNVQKGGTSNSWLNIMRATGNDAACTSAAGWVAGYGTNAVFYETAFAGVNNSSDYSSVISINSSTSYVNIDGRTTNGITLICNPNVNISVSGVGIGGNSKSNIIVANFGIVGPCPSIYTNNASSWSNPGYSDGISIYPASGSGISSVTIKNCEIRGFFQAVYIGGYLDSTRPCFGIVIDHCRLHNIGGDVTQHSDLVYACMSGPLVFRYNEVWDWSSMAIFLFPATNGVSTILNPVYIYGNVFHDPSSGSGIYPVVLESSSGFTAVNSVGPVYYYNNTIYNSGFFSFYFNPPHVLATASRFFNNIFIQNSAGFNGSDSYGTWDYNYSDQNIFAVSEPHGIKNTGLDPLASPGVWGNFMIVSNIGAFYPRNAGVALASITDSVLGVLNFNIDPVGTTRGADGAWDIGAYEYAAANATNSTGNAIISVSPATIDFGPVSANSSVTNSLTVQNVGGGTLTGTASVSAPFNIVSGGTYSLGANQTQQVVISYSPNGAPTNSAVVNFSNASGSGTNATVVGSIIMPTPSGFKITSL
jgi:hypothetical protein